MEISYVIGIIITVAVSLNGAMIKLFVSSVRELKQAIKELSVSIRGSQKDIEFLYKTTDLHGRILDKHTEEIEELKQNPPETRLQGVRKKK